MKKLTKEEKKVIEDALLEAQNILNHIRVQFDIMVSVANYSVNQVDDDYACIFIHDDDKLMTIGSISGIENCFDKGIWQDTEEGGSADE